MPLQVRLTEIHQLEDNTVSVEKSLAEMGSSKTNKPTEANANVAKAGKEKEKPDKSKAKAETPKKEEKDSKESKKEQGGKETKDTNRSKDVAAAANATEGTGKGASKSSQDKNDKQQQPDRSKRPCMYFAFDSCTKGEKCQYLHDKKNLYKGPKPAGLKSSADASAGAANRACRCWPCRCRSSYRVFGQGGKCGGCELPSSTTNAIQV